MKLNSFLNQHKTFFRMKCDNYQHAISQLLDHLISQEHLNADKSQILNKILQRETESSMIYETGIALPHARLENFNDTVFCIGIPEQTINEKYPVKMIVLILTAKASSKIYLGLLSAFMQISMNKELFNSILHLNNDPAANRDHRLSEILSDVTVQNEMLSRDIMTKPLFTVSETDTVKKVIDLFSQYQVFYSPVVDKNNQLIGEINILDIFKIGLPDYTLMMPNINFLKSMEPFEELLTHEDQMLIKDIMIKPAVTITSDSPVIMAAYEMIQHGVMTIPVVSGNNYLGIINYSDILNKVLRV